MFIQRCGILPQVQFLRLRRRKVISEKMLLYTSARRNQGKNPFEI